MLSKQATEVLVKLRDENILMGGVKKLAKSIKKDHELAMELWKTKEYFPRLLSVLILDKKEITQEFADKLAYDIKDHDEKQRNQIVDWLLANQLVKSAKTMALTETWMDHESPALRRTYWFYQGRLRWTGKIPKDNATELLDKIETDLENEEPEVQWAMNFCVGWIGVYDPKHRKRSVAIGEKVGLYKDEHVSRGCTPNYLPEFIRIESEKAGT